VLAAAAILAVSGYVVHRRTLAYTWDAVEEHVVETAVTQGVEPAVARAAAECTTEVGRRALPDGFPRRYLDGEASPVEVKHANRIWKACLEQVRGEQVLSL
jgi:hypothetical protein